MIKLIPKCPECGSLNIKDNLTCLDCGYEYFIWDVEIVFESTINN